MSTIAIIDYGLGNIRSIQNAIEKTGVDVCLTQDADKILIADGVVLPGVGAFKHGMEKLVEANLDTTLHQFVKTGKPLLGVCLGMQLLFDKSEEFGAAMGLGLIPGEVLRLETHDMNCTKLPHIGWNELKHTVSSNWDRTILNDVNEADNFYFVHSYYVKPKNTKDILSTTIYSGFEYCSTVKYGNIYGCQYHPEKSALAGLSIMNNFVAICKGQNDE